MLLHVIGLFSVFVAFVTAAEIHIAIIAPTSVFEMTFAKYDPKEVTIKVGDIVTWTQTLSWPHVHTVTSSVAEFDSGLMSKGDTYSHEFKRPGIFNYHCTLNPFTMVGTITVE